MADFGLENCVFELKTLSCYSSAGVLSDTLAAIFFRESIPIFSFHGTLVKMLKNGLKMKKTRLIYQFLPFKCLFTEIIPVSLATGIQSL